MGFPVFFAGMWLMVTGLIASFGGWRALAERYTGRSLAPAAAAGWSSASLSRGFLPSNYNGVLNVVVGADGVELEPIWAFRFRHPPLLIPWSALEGMDDSVRFGFFRRVRLQVREPRVAITFGGRAAHLVGDHVAALNAAAVRA